MTATLSLAIVGAGALGTYALERLAASSLAGRFDGLARMQIGIFERTGRFGAGRTHHDLQPRTSMLNRVVGQLTMSADESNEDASVLLPRELRPTFYEWCRQQFARTGEARYDVEPDDYVPRALYGQALAAAFDRFCAILRARPNISLYLAHGSVVDVERLSRGRRRRRLHWRRPDGTAATFDADRVLFVTGHPERPAASQASFIAEPYPLERQLAEASLGRRSLGIVGMGLTAIDIILWLTEGRGGVFEAEHPDHAARGLRYVASGREPTRIVVTSRSGAFTHARSENAKVTEHAEIRHEGVFFTLNALERLRARHGAPAPLRGRTLRQLDFERHVLPLMILEMAYVHDRTLLGAGYGEWLRELAPLRLAYEDFLLEPPSAPGAGISALCAPVAAAFARAARFLERQRGGLACEPEDTELAGLGLAEAFERASRTFDAPRGARGNGRRRSIAEHRFDWASIAEPLQGAPATDSQAWESALRAFLEDDNHRAAAGNLCSPIKAACDAVWRDLRAVLAAAVDGGGLCPASHRRFVSHYLRYHNRLANGASVGAMQKVLALVRQGVLDVSVGPSPEWRSNSDGGFVVQGRRTGATRTVDVLIEGRIATFDPDSTRDPLYRSLVERGEVRKWENCGEGERYAPGGLDLTSMFHPCRADGAVDTALTFLGPALDGVAFFQPSAARPHANNYVLNNVARWANELCELVAQLVSESASTATLSEQAS